MASLTVNRTAGGENGITWTELYILYRMYGFDKPKPDASDKAAGRATVKQQVQRFKAGMRAMVSTICRFSSDQDILKPCKYYSTPLKGFGVLGGSVMLPFNVILSASAQRVLDEQLVKLLHKISGKKLREFFGGTLRVLPRKLVLKGRLAWDNAIPKTLHPERTFEEPAGSRTRFCSAFWLQSAGLKR